MAGHGQQLSLGQGEKLWSPAELAEFLGKPVSWVYDNHRTWFRSYKVGQAVRFKPDEVIDDLCAYNNNHS